MAAYPLIGVSGSIDAEETRHFILRDYLTAVIAAGGAPVLLSPDMKGDMLEDCLAHLDGLLMAGGNDVSPALFGEPPVEALGEVNPLRDGFEMRLVRLAAARRMPVLGICRGVQAMAAALGGSLWQDLPSQYRTADGNPPIAHRQTSPGRYASHTVSVLPGTLLARLTDGAETLRVNSFHHQAVKAPGSLPRGIYTKVGPAVDRGTAKKERRWGIGLFFSIICSISLSIIGKLPLPDRIAYASLQFHSQERAVFRF